MMRSTIWVRLTGVLALIIFSASTYAESISGNHYNELSDKQKGWYLLGVIDAMKQTRDVYFAASSLEQNEFDRIWKECISGRPVRQHLAVFESWLKDNPARWHEPAIDLVFAATKESCQAAQARNP